MVICLGLSEFVSISKELVNVSENEEFDSKQVENYLKEEFNPKIVESLNRMSEIIKEEEGFIQKETRKIFEEIVLTSEENKIEYNIKIFNIQERVIQKRLILLGIQEIVGNTKGIEKVNIDDIIKLCNNNIGNKFIEPTKGVRVGIKNKRIYIEKT